MWDYASRLCGEKYFSSFRLAEYLVRRGSNTASFDKRKEKRNERPLLFFRNKRLTFQAKESIWYTIEMWVGLYVDRFYSENKVSFTLVLFLFWSFSQYLASNHLTYKLNKNFYSLKIFLENVHGSNLFTNE